MTEFLTIIAIVGTGASAGVFFSFSTFAMRGLGRLAPAAGAEAMQEINREAPKPPLMTLMFGTAVVSVALIVGAAADIDQTGAIYQLIAGALYIVGVIMVTGMYHVPRNNALDRLDPATQQGERYWQIYLHQWVRMNHVRTLAPLVAVVLLAISLGLD